VTGDGSAPRVATKVVVGAGVLIAAVAVAFVLSSSSAAAPCARPRGSTRALASLELAQKLGARDTMAVVRVCLATKDPKVRIGSYHGLLTYDSLAARLIRVDKGKQGMKIENTTRAGAIDFAGAFPGGLDDSVALTLRLALTKPGKLPTLRLHMFELNSLSGTVLTSTLRVTGYPASVRTTPGPLRRDTAVTASRNPPVRAESAKSGTSSGGGPPGGSSSATSVHLESVTPASALPGDPVTVVIRGKGFTATGNTVRFGRIEIADLPSADGGTMIRVGVPTEFPATGEVPPKQIGSGEYPLVVRNSRGTSNELRFVLRN